MHEYVEEMFFDFYPNADGLLIESSDYAICNCPDCGPHFYDHEFDFVRTISDEVWQRKPDATILVFPHYFTGAKVPGLDATAARQPFDPRWGFVFSPHSSHFDAHLMAKRGPPFFGATPPLFTRRARLPPPPANAPQHGVTGFVPSLEAFSYVATGPEAGEPWVVGKRHQPFGFDPQWKAKCHTTRCRARAAIRVPHF